MISEFGACMTEANCVQEINQVAQVSDEYLVGWGYWQFKFYQDLTTSAGTGSEGFYNSDGSLQQWKVKALARSYLPYTQGILTKQAFNTENADFSAEFTYKSSVQAPTRIYLNSEYWYTKGVVCSVSDLNILTDISDLAEWNQITDDYLEVYFDNQEQLD